MNLNKLVNVVGSSQKIDGKLWDFSGVYGHNL